MRDKAGIARYFQDLDFEDLTMFTLTKLTLTKDSKANTVSMTLRLKRKVATELLTIILLLNLLIAVVGASRASVAKEATRVARFSRAKIMLEIIIEKELEIPRTSTVSGSRIMYNGQHVSTL